MSPRQPAPAIPSSLVPFVAIGAVSTIAGGIAAAVTGPTGWEHGSWVAAFMVLVTGVGQIGLGIGQAFLSEVQPSAIRVAVEATTLNAGAALVVAGTLASHSWLVSIGALVFASALVVFALTTWSHETRHRWVGAAYVTLLVVLIMSTPVGIALSWARR